MDPNAGEGPKTPSKRRNGVSLCVTVFNESDSIEAWLRSIAAQTQQPDELVVVDAGSVDGTREFLEEADLGPATTLKVVLGEGDNVPEGRNRAISLASNDLIAVTDGGTILQEDWLERLVGPLRSDETVAVSAGFYRPDGRNFFERILATVITPRRGDLADDGFPPSSRSVAFRRVWWEKVGGYPEWLRAGEDLVFDYSLRAAGANFVFADKAIVRWFPRPSLYGFFKQYKHYARGDGHGHLFFKRHFARYTAYASGVVLLLAGFFLKPFWLLLVAGLLVYLWKYVSRVHDEKPYRSIPEGVASFALVPLIVFVGDMGKMVGFPVGLWERWRAGGPEGLRRARIESHRGAPPSVTSRIPSDRIDKQA